MTDKTVTAERAREALDSLDDFAKMDVSVDPIGARETIRRFIDQHSQAGMDEAVEAVLAVPMFGRDVPSRGDLARAILTAAGLPALVAECERLRVRVDELNRGIGQWSKAYFYVTDILPLDERNLCRDPVCPMNLAEQDRHRVDVLIGERDALREGNRLHDAIVLPATVANERELIDRAEQAEARAVDSERDAGRYRWLRECSVVRSDRAGVRVKWPEYEHGKLITEDCYLCHEDLDAEIDAAIAQVGGT